MAENKNDKTVALPHERGVFRHPTETMYSICSYELNKDDDMAFDNFVTQYIDKLPSTISGYNLVSEGNYPVGDYPDSYRIVYEGDTGDGQLRLQQTFIKAEIMSISTHSSQSPRATIISMPIPKSCSQPLRL